MFGSTRLRLIASVVTLTTSIMLGCKSGGGGFASRKHSQAAKQPAGPALGSPSNLAAAHRQVPTLEKPERAGYTQAKSTGRQAAKPGPQLTCPIDGKPLGVTGAPVATTLKGEPIFVCSDACMKKAQKDPDKCLARVRAETYSRD